MAVTVTKVSDLRISDGAARARLADNWQTVLGQVDAAAQRAGRAAGSVRIVGVTKYVDATIAGWLVAAGCGDLGENRPQSLVEKATALLGSTLVGPAVDGRPVRWHQIGHLQRNKVRRLLASDPLIHSIDSPTLLSEVHDEAVKQSRTIEVLIEVNLGDESAKTGMAMGEAKSCLESWRGRVAASPPLTSPPLTGGASVIGLMAMAPLGTDHVTAGPYFAKLRGLRDELVRDVGMPLPELSMGMSGDYEAAIAEGATLVRIGTRLFEGVLPAN